MNVTIFIIIFTALVSILAWRNMETFDKLKLNPYMVVSRKEYFRLISHALIHVDWSHLIFNMLTLFFFGKFVEYYLSLFFKNSIFIYLMIYIIGAIVSSIPTLLKHKNDHWYNSVGASGAVAAILFTGILFDPKLGINIYFIPIDIPGYVFGLFYLVYSHYMSKKNTDNINHDAHLTGAIFGFFFPVLLKPSLFLLFMDNLLS